MKKFVFTMLSAALVAVVSFASVSEAAPCGPLGPQCPPNAGPGRAVPADMKAPAPERPADPRFEGRAPRPEGPCMPDRHHGPRPEGPCMPDRHHGPRPVDHDGHKPLPPRGPRF